MGEEKLKEQFLIIEDVAKIANVSLRHIKDEIKRGNLRAYKPGKRLIFDPIEVTKWIRKTAV